MRFLNFLRGKWIEGVRLSEEQQHTLIAVYQGAALRSQRDIEGGKRFELRKETDATPVSRSTILDLRTKGLIETNHKFPSATFLLTTAAEATA